MALGFYGWAALGKVHFKGFMRSHEDGPVVTERLRAVLTQLSLDFYCQASCPESLARAADGLGAA